MEGPPDHAARVRTPVWVGWARHTGMGLWIDRAVLGQLGAGWNEPGAASIFGAPTAIESRVLLAEDVAEWPDEKGVEELALRFAARIDLAFGGCGTRHLDRGGPEPERFIARW